LARLAFLNRDPHLANMPIDSKRLTEDCATAQAARADSDYPHRNTGATAIIEPVLPLIRELRAQKFSWAAIASALAAQGVVQRREMQLQQLKFSTAGNRAAASPTATAKAQTAGVSEEAKSGWSADATALIKIDAREG
jgi:hypothetical protein